MLDASSSIISTIIFVNIKAIFKKIANIKFVDYFCDNGELFVYDASRIL